MSTIVVQYLWGSRNDESTDYPSALISETTNWYFSYRHFFTFALVPCLLLLTAFDVDQVLFAVLALLIVNRLSRNMMMTKVNL